MNTSVLKIKTLSSQKTKNFAKLLAGEILARPPKISLALVLALTGDLGSGKTTFIQGFCKGIGIKRRITSPTFVIFKKFKIQNSKFKILYHIDCYRIQKPKELLKLGFQGIINNPKNIVLIEWAEKIKKLLPKKTIWIKFDYGKKEKERKIIIKSTLPVLRTATLGGIRSLVSDKVGIRMPRGVGGHSPLERVNRRCR